MRMWQCEAQALPVRVRPLKGETIPSFARRLSEANGLRPTMILSAIGALQNRSAHQLLRRDAILNDLALDRLSTFSATSSHDLQHALPALRSRENLLHLPHALPPTVPAMWCYLIYPVQPCSRCVSRAAAAHRTAPAVVRPTASGSWICRIHRRWLGINSVPGEQVDLTEAPEVIQAHRRYQRLLIERPDHGFGPTAYHDATWITSGWANARRGGLYPDLRVGWAQRAERLAPIAPTHPAITFPETVALAEMLTDLKWRRHLAMLDIWRFDPFYRAVAMHLQQTLPTGYRLWGSDPLKAWAVALHQRYKPVRDQFFTDTRHLAAYTRPLPEIRHFK